MADARRRFTHSGLDAGACIVILAIAGAAFWLGVWPVMRSETQARLLAKRMGDSQTQLDQTQRQYRQLREQIAGTIDRLEDIEIVLNTPDQLAARQADIGRVFAGFGLTVEQLSVGEIESGELLDTVPLRLTGAGDFPDLVRTMHGMRDEFPDMAITTFQIAGTGAARTNDRKEEPSITFGLNLDWFVAGDGAGSS